MNEYREEILLKLIYDTAKKTIDFIENEVYDPITEEDIWELINDFIFDIVTSSKNIDIKEYFYKEFYDDPELDIFDDIKRTIHTIVCIDLKIRYSNVVGIHIEDED